MNFFRFLLNFFIFLMMQCTISTKEQQIITNQPSIYPSFANYAYLNEEKFKSNIAIIKHFCEGKNDYTKTTENDNLSLKVKFIITKSKNYKCTYNFREELIQFEEILLKENLVSFQINIYEDHPTSIRFYEPNSKTIYTRNWQWIQRRSRWESTMTYLSYFIIEKDRCIEYFFSRYTGGIVRKLSYTNQDNKILDGWNFNPDEKDESPGDKCYLYEQGNLLDTSLDKCQFELFKIEIKLNLNSQELHF